MKKFFGMITFVLALMLLLTACGGSTDTSNPASGGNSVADSTPTSDSDPSPSSDPTPVPDNTPASDSVSSGFYAIGGTKVRGIMPPYVEYGAVAAANGGQRTLRYSFYDVVNRHQLYSDNIQLDMTITVEWDEDAMLASFINDEADFFFTTVNKLPMVCKTMADAGVEVVVPYFPFSSTGDMTTALSAPTTLHRDGDVLIIGAMVVNKEFAENHRDAVATLINGCICMADDYALGFQLPDISRQSEFLGSVRTVPDFPSYSEKELKEFLSISRWIGYELNMDLFAEASDVYSTFMEEWKKFGKEVIEEPDGLFDTSYIETRPYPDRDFYD